MKTLHVCFDILEHQFSVFCYHHLCTTVFHFLSLKTFYIGPGIGQSPERLVLEYSEADHGKGLHLLLWK